MLPKRSSRVLIMPCGPPQGKSAPPAPPTPRTHRLDPRTTVPMATEGGKIGIGGDLAVTPLPHHRTCGSASGGSVGLRIDWIASVVQSNPTSGFARRPRADWLWRPLDQLHRSASPLSPDGPVGLAATGPWRRAFRRPSHTVRAFPAQRPVAYTAGTTPSADFCRALQNASRRFPVLRRTPGRSPEVSSTAFHARPLDLRFASLMDVGFAILCPLARCLRL